MRQTLLRCPRCVHLNWNHPAIIAGKLLLVLLVCTAIGLVIYLSVHSDEYSGTKPEPLPGNERPMIDLHRPAEPEAPAEPKFSDK